MKKSSLSHLQFLQTVCRDINVCLKFKPRIEVLVPSQSPVLQLLSIKHHTKQTLGFDCIVECKFLLNGRYREVWNFVDEDMKGTDSRGQDLDWKSSVLERADISYIDWTYWVINGASTYLLAVKDGMDLPVSISLADTLVDYNNWYLNPSSLN